MHFNIFPQGHDRPANSKMNLANLTNEVSIIFLQLKGLNLQFVWKLFDLISLIVIDYYSFEPCLDFYKVTILIQRIFSQKFPRYIGTCTYSNV